MKAGKSLNIRAKIKSVVRRAFPPEPKPLILMYHRVADEPIDPWALAVSPAHFEEQLSVIRRMRRPFPLIEFVDRLFAGTLPKDAVALTFDDGYVDNLELAKPRLSAADVPATVFLATGFLDSTEPFWWDELAALILSGESQSNLAQSVRAAIPEIIAHSDLLEDKSETTERRRAVLYRVWEPLRRLNDQQRRSAMIELESQLAPRGRQSIANRAMTGSEVRALIADGLIAIGAHTVSHPVLAGLGAAACYREVAESKAACEVLIGAPVTTFAYPYGAFDTDAREAVRSAGLTVACSTRPGPAVSESDLLALPRVHVANLNGDAFEQSLHAAAVNRGSRSRGR
jgi:peptidoglycan/xylan/chitin deacetylase (PgdA/CDA1 family)